MPYLLDLLYFALVCVCSPMFVYRAWKDGKYREGWGEKFLGRAPRRMGGSPCVWFHAVSVGEVLLLRPIVADLSRRRPGWEVVISTTTRAGLQVARKSFPDRVTFYAPLDFSWSTRRAMARVRPTVLALVELELWPNLVRSAKRVGAQVAIINGRLSVRSHRGYRAFRGPLRTTLRRLDSIGAQSEEYANRFIDLGVDRAKVHVTGSVKYDGLESDRNNDKTLALRKDLGIRPADLVFVAGSTMEGEEAAALNAYHEARLVHPGLRLVLVPRHSERFDKIADWLMAKGEGVVRRSRGPVSTARFEPPPVILIDTIGELGSVWGLADVAFVGGSLYPGRNGQNMMEPAAFGASVLFGPYTSNFREAVEGLLARDGARRIQNANELAVALLDDLNDPERALARGTAGRQFVLSQNGASARTLAAIDELVAANGRS